MTPRNVVPSNLAIDVSSRIPLEAQMVSRRCWIPSRCAGIVHPAHGSLQVVHWPPPEHVQRRQSSLVDRVRRRYFLMGILLVIKMMGQRLLPERTFSALIRCERASETSRRLKRHDVSAQGMADACHDERRGITFTKSKTPATQLGDKADVSCNWLSQRREVPPQ